MERVPGKERRSPRGSGSVGGLGEGDPSCSQWGGARAPGEGGRCAPVSPVLLGGPGSARGPRHMAELSRGPRGPETERSQCGRLCTSARRWCEACLGILPAAPPAGAASETLDPAGPEGLPACPGQPDSQERPGRSVLCRLGVRPSGRPGPLWRGTGPRTAGCRGRGPVRAR